METSEYPITLTSKGLKQVKEVDPSHEIFTFIVGSDHYNCYSYQACFISSMVCNMMKMDPTMNSLVVDIDDPHKDFRMIESLWSGDTININVGNYQHLRQICEIIGNEELHAAISEYEIVKQEITLANAISRLHLKSTRDINYDEEAEFIAKNFFQYNLSELSILSPDALGNVIKNPSLRLQSENSLLDIIFDLMEQNSSYSSLFEHIEFEYLDSEHIDLFLERVYPDHLDQFAWHTLCRFIHNIGNGFKREESDRFIKETPIESFQYEEDAPFSGVFDHLRTECGGNVHDKGIVAITASADGWNKCYQVTDYDWNSYWCSRDSPGSWIQFDFKDSRLSVSGYTIKSDGNGMSHLLKWAIEGSNDGNEWICLDCRDTQKLNGNSRIKNFTCSQQNSEFFRYVRLRQTGKNSSDCDFLVLTNIEFFGSLKGESGEQENI